MQKAGPALLPFKDMWTHSAFLAYCQSCR